MFYSDDGGSRFVWNIWYISTQLEDVASHLQDRFYSYVIWFIYNSISSLCYMALNSKMNWKGLEIGLGLTELLFQHLTGGIEENYRTCLG
jgi:hypothetical protein